MATTIQAELVSIGTELLRGEITDTNATYLASQLPLLGIELHRITTAGDNLVELTTILQQATERSQIVITSGGLGPTQDDLTREAVAALFGETLAIDPQLESDLRSIFSRFGREMPPHNINQAMIIPSAKGLKNPRGTAPGWWAEKQGKMIVLLPGPPREMTFMWQNEVIPLIKQRFATKPIFTRTIKTFFIAEAKVAELAQPFFKDTNPTLGIYAKPDGIQIRFLATGDNSVQLLDEAEKQLAAKLTPFVWGKDEETLDGLLSKWLIHRKLTVATSENFTGGLLASILTSTKDTGLFYRGGMVTPASALNTGDTANESAAVSLVKQYQIDFGISVSGIDASGNVYISIANTSGVKTWQQQYQAGRPDNRERAAMAALFRLRERLLELN
ncbi:MAG: CinA family nicotinamide mononucleotide deamidase-related protein, partial [Dehalococcoidales bacterium]|nr:CinA family nicotinamide mononucleotide deamidase-related protein [Dehalococcoidales bacterium]